MAWLKLKENISNWSHTPKIKRLFLVLTIYAASVDFYGDWRFYLDIVSLRPGLVYGYVGNDIVIPLFVFTVIGSILYTFEMVYLICQVFGRKVDILNFDTFMILLTWFDTIPHLTINALIASCHEYSISYIQFARAIVSVSLFFLRLILTVLGYCTDKIEKDDERCCNQPLPCPKLMFYHVANIVGFALQIVLSLLIFQFTFIQTFNGYMQFHFPNNIITGHIKPGRYFRTVNMYLSTNVFDEDYSSHWMNIASLNHVIYSQRYEMSCDVRLSIYRQMDTPNHNAMLHFNKQFINLDGKDASENQCWMWSKHSKNLHSKNCSEIPNRYALSKSFLFHIRYLPPSEYSQFGQIIYQSFKAQYPEKYIQQKIPLRYFTTENGGFMLGFLSKSFNGTRRFYKIETDLHSVKSIWKTGYGRCETNAPQYPLYIVGKGDY